MQNFEKCTDLWLKGQRTNLAKLVGKSLSASELAPFEGGCVAISRLAPNDYHRWHMPVAGTIEQLIDIQGEYYSVSPHAVRNVDTFSINRRAVCIIESASFGRVLMIPVGAAGVGSIVFQCKEGESMPAGAMHGYFE